MTIEQFVIGKFEYEFSALNIESVFTGRGVPCSAEHYSVDEKTIDLIMSDLYMILSNVSNGGGKRITKGNRTITDKSYSFTPTDRTGFRNEANRLRVKWGEASVNVPNVKFANLFGR